MLCNIMPFSHYIQYIQVNNYDFMFVVSFLYPHCEIPIEISPFFVVVIFLFIHFNGLVSFSYGVLNRFEISIEDI